MMITSDRFLADKSADFEAWLEARRTGVTATQVANASTPAGFERAAAEFLVEFREQDNEFMRFGRDMEPHIAEFVSAEFGVEPNEWLIRNDKFAHHLATPDGLSKNGEWIGEYKTTGRDWETVEKLPLRYRRQVQWQLHVTGALTCVVAWIVREEVDGLMVPASFTPKHGLVHRNEEMIQDLVVTADRLWRFVNGG